jgi:hypothetical protein
MRGTVDTDFQFIDKELPKIEGWLLPEAAQLTVSLMRTQDSHEVGGPLLEFGVWRGKYLSLLYHASRERVIGIDIFEWGNTPEEVWNTFKRIFGDPSRLVLTRADSRDLTPTRISEIAGTHGCDLSRLTVPTRRMRSATISWSRKPCSLTVGS